jgi:DNA repair exonuclease SbcCD ATPase subunit
MRLLKLSLKNFKGIKEFTLDTNGGKNTNIYGDNGTGKTTIFDAFTWLLFDKDSSDRSKFDIQPLDKQGNVIHMIDTEVEGVLDIDGKTITLKKILREKWVKKRGEAESELKGTETLYYINDVPVKQSEYKAYINELIDESIFKMITNPLYFGLVLKWQDRRKVLLDMVGDVSDEDVVSSRNDLKELASLLNNTDIETLKKSIVARKKKLNDDIKAIPYRIDELNNTIQEFDFEALEFRKKFIQAAIDDIEAKLADSSKIDEEVLKDKKRLYELQSELMKIEQEAKNEAYKEYEQLNKELQNTLIELNTEKSRLAQQEIFIENAKKEIERLEKENEELRERWRKENKKELTFDENLFVCPVCKRPFEEADIEAKKEEMLKNFNFEKAETLKKITAQGKENNKKIEELKKKISEINTEEIQAKILVLDKRAKEIKAKIDNFKPVINLDNNERYKEIKSEIETIENKLSKQYINTEKDELKKKLVELKKELEQVNSKLAYKEHNEKAKARIEELKKQERELARQIAELERQEFLAEEFIKAKVELLQNKIDSKFKYVKFKMFDIQVNGGIAETCEPMVDGVPFSTNLNFGARINAGLDIINALCDYYNIQAPIFIDNKESITKLIETKSQVISLIVSERDKKLRVEVV